MKRDIESHIDEQFHDAVDDLYRRLAEAVEQVSKRLNGDGKPLVSRDTMISNIRDPVDLVSRLNIFGDQTLAARLRRSERRVRGRRVARKCVTLLPQVRRALLVVRDAFTTISGGWALAIELTISNVRRGYGRVSGDIKTSHGLRRYTALMGNDLVFSWLNVTARRVEDSGGQ